MEESWQEASTKSLLNGKNVNEPKVRIIGNQGSQRSLGVLTMVKFFFHV
jgi:hypothetical protein